MILLLLLALLLSSCSPAPPQQQAPTAPLRIISVVPSATEMLFAIGLGERVVGVGDFDRFPPEVATRVRVGGLINPNMEKIIELKPDLVIAYGTQNSLGERLKSVGIRLHPFVHGNIEQTLQYMLELGRMLKAEPAAQAVADRIQKTFEEVRAQAPAQRPRVLLVHNRQVGTMGSFYSVGSAAFQHELISIAGGENIFGDVRREVVQPSLEEIISRAPEIIIETLPPPLDPVQAGERRKDWSRLKLPAVLNDRVHVIAEDSLLVPGPRLDVAARLMGGIIRER